MDMSTQRQVDVQVGDHQVAAIVAVPEEATGAVVVAGGPDQDAQLGRIAHDLREARLATLLLHVEPARSGEDPEAPTPERTAWEQARIAAAIDRLRQEPAAADQPIGLFLQGAAADGGLRAAAGLPVDALVCYNGRFAPDDRDAGEVPPVPSLLLLDGEAAPQLADENEAARRALGERAELQGLPAAFRSDEERLQEVVAIAVRWFDRHL
jgi:dienelactone hydrolase